MKNFKRVLSLALAALMVIGGLVIAPVDAKADDTTTYNRVWDKRDVENGGEFVLVYANSDGKYYAVGNTFASSNRPKQVEVTVSNNVVSLPAGSEVTALPTWTFTKTGSAVGTAEVARVNLSYSNNGTTTYFNWSSSTKFETTTATTSLDEWVVIESNDCFTLMETESSRFLSFYPSGTDFRPYALGSGADGCNEYMLFKTGTVISEADDVDSVLTAEYDTYAKIVDAAYELAEGASLSDPGDGSSKFTLQGTVISYDGTLSYSPYSPIYTIVVEGKEDKPIQCYGLKTGEATGVDPASVQVGDVITVNGAIKNYYGTVEFNGCTLDAYVAGPGVGTYANQQAVVDAVLALNNGYGLAGTHTLSGVVSKVENDTVYFTIGNATITVYKPYDADKAAIDLTTIAAGDTVSVTGVVKNNDGVVEFLKNSTTTVTKATTGGDNNSENESESESGSNSESETESTTTITAAEILAEAAKLEDGEYLGGSKDNVWSLKGVITEIGEYNSTYNDVSLTIKVNGTDETIYCYCVKGDGNDTLKVGDEIALKGAIKNYKGTIELEKPELVSINAKGDMNTVGVYMILFAGVALVAVAVINKRKMA